METLIFVLGALSGLLLIVMVYAFVGVLKMQKEVKSLNLTIDCLQRDNQDLENRMYAQFEKSEREIQKEVQYISAGYQELHQTLQRYVDSRLDKTIDAMSLRMDVVIDEHKKEFEHVHLNLK
jgi:biopolymer transport protein ExbB/TolQ